LNSANGKSLFRHLVDNRFLATLLALVLLFAITPFVSESTASIGNQIARSIIFLLVLGTAAFAIAGSPLTRIVVIATGGAAAAADLSLLVTDSILLHVSYYALVIVFLLVFMTVTTKYVLGNRYVDRDMLAAALCIYGAAIVLWAVLYSLINLVDPQAFAFPNRPDDAFRFGADASSSALYFSFITITTLGYGDIVPESDAARLLAAFEAFAGQIYLAILIARLVGLHIAVKRD